jgi:hypothetical protein
MNTTMSTASSDKRILKTQAHFEDLFRKESETLDADRISSSRFSANDFSDPAGLASKLCRQSDPVSSFLWMQMTEADRNELKILDETSADTEKIRFQLAEFLNQILTQGSIYDPQRFANIQLREETEELVKLHPHTKTLPLLARRLLEDAYPEHLTRKPAPQNPWRILPLDHTEEPWVAFTTQDRVGLALSGGGIRSATFNLGIMQALKSNQVLERVSYLSTVSGGGYIGGFWTRWWRGYQKNERNRQNTRYQKDFPFAAGSAGNVSPQGPKEIREPPEFRHLREFSRFLIPRQGLNTEFWGAVSTILTGLAPSLVAAMAAVLLVMTVWVWLAAGLVRPDVWVTIIKNHTAAFGLAGISPAQWHTWGSGFLVAGLVAIVLVASEWLTSQSGRLAVAESMRGNFTAWYTSWSILAIAAVLASWVFWIMAGDLPGDMISLDPRKTYSGVQPYVFNALVFRPCEALLAALAVLTVVRLLWGRFIRPKDSAKSDGLSRPMDGDAAPSSLIAQSAALDHVMARILAVLVTWAALSGVWELARWLDTQASAKVGGGVGGVTAVLTLLFYWARHWLTQPKKDQADLKFLDRLKPFVPQILANSVVLLLFVLAAVFILGKLDGGLWSVARIFGVCAIVMGLVLLLFDPAKFGLHEFYRSRVTRCYLGASQSEQTDKSNEETDQSAPSDNRMTVECPDDDMYLCEDSGRPIHLICCAANHFWGDPLSTLHRGARSATLSRFGIALGDYWMTDVSLRLSSALTASAAAFNSLMGELNLQLGRAVPFVMTALNLRLGLWVKNPAHPHHRSPKSVRFPGQFFLKEMVGWAQCRTDKYAGAYVHLSDGGHFENLALYELIRRHCRYIIVSDAGEDQELAFTDFGRAVRRVREDFGVEIEIDLTSLKRDADGMSKQHIAVGTIHYDGVEGTDKGTIVYFKPTLTGDEPADVLQYHRRKSHFPHESTGDQFFDEAQFESYRRLGEHTANSSLRMLERLSGDLSPRDDETLFRNIRLHWYRVPWMQGDAGIRLCDHAADLEVALLDKAREAVRQEFIGDILTPMAITPTGAHRVGVKSAAKRVGGQTVPVSPAGARSATPTSDGEQTASDVLLAIRVFKFIEEAWVVCDLERYSSHPLAQSWMSYLQRWAAMPTMRKWWPVLRTMFGSDFQTFADLELYLQTALLPGATPLQVRFELVRDPAGNRLNGFAWRRLQECFPGFSLGTRIPFNLELKLTSGDGSALMDLQVGLTIVHIDHISAVATWAIDDLFVPPELSGGGFHSRLLDSLITHFKDRHGPDNSIHRLEVTLGDVLPATAAHLRRSQSWRQAQLERIDFYRSRGFKFDGADWSEEGHNKCMVLVLKDT